MELINRLITCGIKHPAVRIGFLITGLICQLAGVHHPALSAPASVMEQESLRGVVIDAEEGHPIPGSTIQIADLNLAAVTDRDGIFRFDDLPPGEYRVTVRYLGYRKLETTIDHPVGERLVLELHRDIYDTDDVIVTASPVGRSILYQSAQAYNLQDLQDRSSTSIGQMLDGEPGIAMRSFGPAPARPVIRGFDGDRLLILENGERMGDLSNTAHDHNVAIDPLVPDRIEIVRGPASLLYGSSALGGVINILTSDIPREWESGTSGTIALEGASVNSSAGGFGRYQYASDRWAGTTRASFRGAGDMKTPAGSLNGTYLKQKEVSAGGSHRTDRMTAGAAITAKEYNYGLPEGFDDPDEEAEIRMNQQSVQGRTEWALSGILSKAELRFNGSRLFQQEIESEFGEDGTFDEDVELEFLQYGINTTLTLQHHPFGRIDSGVIGFSGSLRGMDVGGEEAFTPGVDNRSIALFTYHELPLTSLLRLQFGVRGELHGTGTRSNTDFPNLDDRRSETALSGAVGLNLRPFSGFEMGVQLARAHRFPILEELYADGVHFGAGVYERGNRDLNTEVGHGVDLFLRWSNGILHAEIAGFYYRISDYISFEPVREQFVDNRDRAWDVYEYRPGNAQIVGGEAQLTLDITRDLRIGGAVDYVRGTNIDHRSPLPTMPPLRLRLSPGYDNGTWWMRADLRFVRKQTRVVEAESPTDGYALIGANTGIRFGPNGIHRLSLRAENLANTLYRDHLSRIDRSEFGFPMPGRNVSISYRFMF